MTPLSMFYKQIICLHCELIKENTGHYKYLLRLHNKVHKVMVQVEDFSTYMLVEDLIYCHLVLTVQHRCEKLMQQQMCEEFTAVLLQLNCSLM